MHTALVVDDDAMSRMLLMEQLNMLGIAQVVGAADGRVALELLQERAAAPELIVCDLAMPEMDGIEFLEQLKHLSYDGAIIFVSGALANLLDTVQMLARKNGLNTLGVLEKPAHLDQLAQLLEGSSIA